MNSDTIQISDIFSREKGKEFASLHDLLKHIIVREGYFSSTLSDITSHEVISFGWEKVKRRDDGSVDKTVADGPSLDAIFTGQFWCTTACVAVGEVIEETAVKQNLDLTVEIGDIDTDFFGERGPKRVPEKTYISHTILKITDTKKKEIFYLDPTYAQVDHRTAGKFLLITEKEYQDHYRTTETAAPQFSSFKEYNGVASAKSRLSPVSFDRLKKTLL